MTKWTRISIIKTNIVPLCIFKMFFENDLFLTAYIEINGFSLKLIGQK